MASENTSGLPLRRTVDKVVNVHLDDLQAEIEAGSRKLDVLAQHADDMRNAVLQHQLDQAALVGTLIRRVADLRQNVRQQRKRLAELRRAIHAERERRQRADRRR